MARPPPIGRIVITPTKLILSRERIIGSPGVQESRRVGGVRLAQDVTIRIVGDQVQDTAAGANHLTNRVNIVGQEPLHRAVGAHLAVELAQRIGIVQIAFGQLAAAVEIQTRIRTVVDCVQLRRAVQRHGNTVVVDVVGELLIVEHRAAAAFLLHLDQTIAIVSGVIRHVAGGNVRLRRHVAIRVIRIRCLCRSRCPR